MLAVSFAPSFVIAPTAWKYVFKWIGSRFAWATVVGLGFANCLYCSLLLPESKILAEYDAAGGASPKTPSMGTGPPELSKNPFQYFRLLWSSSPVGPESAKF